jgi:hypothetical protein
VAKLGSDEIKVLGHGRLGEMSEDGAIEAEHDVREHIRAAQRAGASETQQRRTHLSEIISAALKDPAVRDCEPDAWPDDRAAYALLEEISIEVIRVIDFTRLEFPGLARLIPYWSHLTLEQWLDILLSAQNDLLQPRTTQEEERDGAQAA